LSHKSVSHRVRSCSPAAAQDLARPGSLPRVDQPDDVCLTIPICANRATRASDRQPDIGERELERLGSAVHARFQATHPSAAQCATEAGHTADNALPHWSSEHLRLLASARFTTEACVTKRTGGRLAARNGSSARSEVGVAIRRDQAARRIAGPFHSQVTGGIVRRSSSDGSGSEEGSNRSPRCSSKWLRVSIRSDTTNPCRRQNRRPASLRS
jgi:hypothetical protein